MPKSQRVFVDVLNKHLSQQLGEGAMIKESARVYSVVVPYKGRTTIKELVTIGAYAWVHNQTTDTHLPQTKVGDEAVNIHLCHFGHLIRTKEALLQLNERGLRAANAAELLALGAVHPQLQRALMIVGLGQTYCDKFGLRCALYLSSWSYERWVGPGWVALRWHRDMRFAAVAL
jgi:hypothetical protein